jgi:hypothetical protein
MRSSGPRESFLLRVLRDFQFADEERDNVKGEGGMSPQNIMNERMNARER